MPAWLQLVMFSLGNTLKYHVQNGRQLRPDKEYMLKSSDTVNDSNTERQESATNVWNMSQLVNDIPNQGHKTRPDLS